MTAVPGLRAHYRMTGRGRRLWVWVKSAVSTIDRSLPVYPNKQTFSMYQTAIADLDRSLEDFTCCYAAGLQFAETNSITINSDRNRSAIDE